LEIPVRQVIPTLSSAALIALLLRWRRKGKRPQATDPSSNPTAPSDVISIAERPKEPEQIRQARHATLNHVPAYGQVPRPVRYDRQNFQLEGATGVASSTRLDIVDSSRPLRPANIRDLAAKLKLVQTRLQSHWRHVFNSRTQGHDGEMVYGLVVAKGEPDPQLRPPSYKQASPQERGSSLPAISPWTIWLLGSGPQMDSHGHDNDKTCTAATIHLSGPRRIPQNPIPTSPAVKLYCTSGAARA